MLTMHVATLNWNLEPSVLLGCAALLVGYVVALRFHLTARSLVFTAGVLVMLFALVSPLDTLGDIYLFSAHMLQHLLLILAVPPLLLLGIPARPLKKVLQVPAINKIERILAKPFVAWPIGTLTMVVWHIPVLYEATLQNDNIHILEHSLFLVTATIFWWPVLSPVEERRISPFRAIFYLFAAMMVSTVLGIILTVAPAGIYPSYLHPVDVLGILPVLQNDWGLNPSADQQVGGLLMWVPGNLVYLCALFGALARWYRDSEEDYDFEDNFEPVEQNQEGGNPSTGMLATPNSALKEKL